MVALGFNGGGGSAGTLQVIKVVEGSDLTAVFDFIAGGGLSPTSFSLGNGESEFYTNLTPGAGYTVEETLVDGWSTTYVVSNGSPIDDLLVVVDETTVVTVTNSNSVLGQAVRDPIRWLRRTPILSDENVRLFVTQMTLDIQTGVGISSGQGSEPVVMFRYSIDSGWTWSKEVELKVGRIGEYFRRAMVHGLGSGRNYVLEFSGSDPVIVALLDVYLLVTKGAH